MGNVPQAKRVYSEACADRQLVYAYSGPTMGEVSALTKECEAAAVYIRALEEREAIRQNAEQDEAATEAHKHRKAGPAQ